MTEKSIVVYGPQGCGKTRHAKAIAEAFGLTTIVDDWDPRDPVLRRQSIGTLFLTNVQPYGTAFDRRVYSFDDAMARVRKDAKARA